VPFWGYGKAPPQHVEGHEEAGKLGYWSTLTRDVCALLGYRSSYVLNWPHQ